MIRGGKKIMTSQYSLTQIEQWILSGENSSIEFKNEQVRGENLAREMVAFANSQGGIILLGVEDDGSISGCSQLTEQEERIMNIARNNVIPSIIPKVQRMEIQNKTTLIIHIEKGLNKPYQTQNHQFLVRVGSTNRTVTQLELLRLFQQAGFFHYDLNEVPHTGIKDIHFSKIEEYLLKYEVSLVDESMEEKMNILKNMDIIGENSEMTVGGLLIFGLHPQRYLRNASISFARYLGDDVTENLLDLKVIEGTLDYQIDTTTALIMSHLGMPSSIQNTKRIDLQETYDRKIMRELIVNACIHRNYAILGSRIRVLMFDHRLEIHSPGRLPNTVTVEKMKRGVSYASNPVLLKFMENLRYIDKLGRGIPMVWKAAMKLHKNIEFQEDGEEFIVILEL